MGIIRKPGTAAGSKVVSISRTANRRHQDQLAMEAPVISPTNPADFGPSFDVIYELTHHRDQYTVTADGALTTFSSFPHFCSYNAIRLAETFTPAISLNPVLVACLRNGLNTINEYNDVIALLSLRRSVHLIDSSVDGQIHSFVNSLFSNFGISFDKGPRLNLRLNESTHTDLSKFASYLGLRLETAAALAVLFTLSEQPSTVLDDSRRMATHISNFLAIVKLRTRVLRVVMKELGVLPRSEE